MYGGAGHAEAGKFRVWGALPLGVEEALRVGGREFEAQTKYSGAALTTSLITPTPTPRPTDTPWFSSPLPKLSS